MIVKPLAVPALRHRHADSSYLRIVSDGLNSLSPKRPQLVFELVSLRDTQTHEVFQQSVNVPSRYRLYRTLHFLRE
jgi:hypothetical protein